MKYKINLIILLIFATFSLSAENIRTISNKNELDKYWQPDYGRMSKIAPVRISDIVGRYDGRVAFHIEYIINTDGIPSNFKLLDAIPKEAMAEENNVKAEVYFRRFKPSSTNTGKEPVKFSGTTTWWDPNKK